MRIGARKRSTSASLSCPAYHGESIVHPDPAARRGEASGFEVLGMQPDTLEAVQQAIINQTQRHLPGDRAPPVRAKPPRCTRPSQQLNRPDRKIITAEDPIEYNFKGINQCQVNTQMKPAAGPSSGSCKAMLRQAPNIILVGEIRDKRSRRSRHSGRPHRPHGVQHAAHERRPLGDHPPDRHGAQALPRGLVPSRPCSPSGWSASFVTTAKSR